MSPQGTKPLLTLEEAAEKYRSEKSHLYFTKKFFYHRQNAWFKVNWHHQYISDVIQDIIEGKRKNVIINVSPGSSKTEMVVINFIARGLAINPRARFLHLSYSDDLALTNSQAARDLVSSEEYQLLWPMRIADDSKAKKRWNVIVNNKPAGGVYAAAAGGQVTGFRAGHMVPGFQGAIIIDDPIKPEDAFSEPKLKQANRRMISTIKSRRANPDTPIILIMQRVSDKDPTQFIKDGNLGGEWSHIVIPAIIDEDYVKSLPEKYRSQIKRDAPDRFSYWPYKERIGELIEMEKGSAVDKDGSIMSRHVFSSQYQQAPRAVGGNLIRGEWFGSYSVLPKIKYRMIFADTAQKIQKRNDYSVFGCFGIGHDRKLYLLDLIRGKWEAPELERRALAFWAKHKHMEDQVPYADKQLGELRRFYVEDKVSGTGLIQSIKTKGGIPIGAVDRKENAQVDKLTRVMDVQSYLEIGSVVLPEDAPFTSAFIEECEAFTSDDTHAFDDQVDVLVDAVKTMIVNNKVEIFMRSMRTDDAPKGSV